MKNIQILYFLTLLMFNSCSIGQAQNEIQDLSASAFSQKIAQTPNAVIIDVRTPDEYAKGHIENAMNLDWNGGDFEKQLAAIDQSKPVFVYCLSGGRSHAAAQQMRKNGFKVVYELAGGIMKWRAAQLPETNQNLQAATGMTRKQFDAILSSDKLVLIDFYADWCQPCKKLKPILEEIAIERKDKTNVIRINVDENQELAKELKIDALPTLQLYKNQKIIWNNIGFIAKESILAQLN